MVIFYDKDKELYYQVYVCVIDTQGDFDDFEITESFFTNLERSFDIERQAYCIDHESWEVFKKQMNEFINNTDSFIRTEDEERYYEIAVATPYYKVYDKWGELCNDGWCETLQMVNESYINTPMNSINQYKVVPFFAIECEFKMKIQQWSGNY